LSNLNSSDVLFIIFVLAAELDPDLEMFFSFEPETSGYGVRKSQHGSAVDDVILVEVNGDSSTGEANLVVVRTKYYHFAFEIFSLFRAAQNVDPNVKESCGQLKITVSSSLTRLKKKLDCMLQTSIISLVFLYKRTLAWSIFSGPTPF
jgi:hypothetical protein